MRVIVTGGAGFIGYHVAKHLVKKNYTVKVLDNFSRASFAKEIRKDKDMAIKQVDIRDKFSLINEFKGYDAVIHLAALISVEESISEPEKYHLVNTRGTLNVLEAARVSEVNKIVFSSSAAVYGEPIILPITEDHPLAPKSMYGATKVAGELYCKAYSENYGIKVCTLRLFNVYGPGQSNDYAGVISIFIRNILSNKPLTIFGDGRQTRDFVYVEDVARIIEKVLNIDKEFEVFNVGTGSPTSVLQIADILRDISSKDIEIIFKPRRAGDITHSYADNSKLLKAIGKFSFTPLREGLRRTFEWFKNYCSITWYN